MAGIFRCSCGTEVVAYDDLLVKFAGKTYCRRDCRELGLARARAEAREVAVDLRSIEVSRNAAMQRRSDAAVARSGAALRLAVATLPAR